jgi:peptidoglycan hydrolase CwlO-like protein
MIVLPESMNKIDVEDSERALSTIDNYIRYMCERIEFAMRNVTKNVSDAGVSSAEMYVLLVALQNTVSEVSSRLSTLTGTVNTMQGTLTSLQDTVSELSTNVSSLSTELSTANSNISALQTSINSLDERVKALEGN